MLVSYPRMQTILLHLKNERISFEEKGIVFPDFRLVDLNNNVATIKGTILTKAYKDFRLRFESCVAQFSID
jgi:hypothetical protein